MQTRMPILIMLVMLCVVSLGGCVGAELKAGVCLDTSILPSTVTVDKEKGAGVANTDANSKRCVKLQLGSDVFSKG